MATIAIQIGIAVAVSVASSKLTPNPKQQPVDRGRLDDLRFTIVEEGAFKPLAYGQRVRLAGVIRWATETFEYVTRTPGRSSGKGGGSRQAEPPANNYTYRKSFAVLVTGNEIKRFRRIWEDTEVIFNGDGADTYADFGEAELATLTGNALVTSGTQFSGGRAVALGSSGGVTFPEVRAAVSGSHKLTIFYSAVSTVNVTVTTNGGAQTVSLPSTGVGVVGSVEATIALDAGADNTILISYTGGSAPTIDRVHKRLVGVPVPDPDPVIVGVLDPGIPYPADLTNPRPFYNVYPEYDPAGTATGTLAGGGQAAFEFYTGTETQPQSPTIVAVEGADETPAWRGDSMVVFNDYLVKEGRLGNLTFEVEPKIQDLAEVVEDLYRQDDRLSATEIDFSALAGTTVPGFIVHTREQLSGWIDQLRTWYNFDVLPVDGKVKAVVRGGASQFTLTEDDLYAHHEGEERPRGAVSQTHEDPADLPGAADVLYIDPSTEKEFHTGAQSAQVQVGDSYDRETLTFAIVGDPDTAHAVGRRWLDQKELEAKPLRFATGPAWRHLVPTDVGDLVLKKRTVRVRLASAQAELQGLVKFQAVPERASLYTQKGAGQLSQGRETPAVEFPANTFLVVADAPPVRPEDVSDLMVYVGGCRRGAGAWRGYVLNKENRVAEYERALAVDKEATIGVVETAANWAGDSTTFDRTTQLRVKLLHGVLESRSEDELLSEFLNVALYGSGNRFEIIQFASAVPEVAAFPYVAQYLITGIWRGRVATEYAMNAHQAGDTFMLLDGDAVHKLKLDPQDINQPLKFKAATFGQAQADAEEVEVTVAGNSQKHPSPADLRGEDDSAGNKLIEFERRVRGPHNLRDFDPAPLADEREEYRVEIRAAGVTTGEPLLTLPVIPTLAQAALLNSNGATKFTQVSVNTLTQTGFSQPNVRARSLQEIEHAGNFAEATLDLSESTFGSEVAFGLVRPGVDWANVALSEIVYYFTYDYNGGTGLRTLKAYHLGTLLASSTTAASDPRVRITLSGGEVRFSVNWTGSGSPAFAVSPTAPSFPLCAFAHVNESTSGATSGVRSIVMTTWPHPKTILLKSQIEKYVAFPAPATVNVRAYQVSALVGPGQYTEREL